MTAAHTAPDKNRTGQPVKKLLLAAGLIVGLAAVAQPSAADARGFGGSGGGHGWGGHGCCGYWGGYWGPAWGVSFYAPYYAWGAYPYGYPYPYYYDPVVAAPAAIYSDYGATIWPQSANAYHQQAYTQALSAPIGQEIAWSSGGVTGSVTPIRDGHSGDRYCREILQKVTIDGHHRETHAATCQTPDGRWQTVRDNP